jgi:hypothetical protein
MLAVMTYNTGVFMIVSIGLAIGYGLTPQLTDDSKEIVKKTSGLAEGFFRSS